MADQAKVPELASVSGQVVDAAPGNWVDLHAPAWTRPYLRLSRADRPIGTWLLLLPCWWGLMLAINASGHLGLHDLWIFVGCGLGAWLMRGAGCTWNDIADRHLDAGVARTRSRPLPSGQASVTQAVIWMTVQALLAFAILLGFNDRAILLGLASLVLVVIYPFAKRFTWWPQVFLGLAFNWGALLAWAAHGGMINRPAIWLYLSGITWTLFYDTIYAHQDRRDDGMIGVRSTARLLAGNTHRALAIFATLSVLLMLAAIIDAMAARADALALAVALCGPLAFGGHLIWQMRRLNINSPETCLALFRTNRDAGLIVWLFLAAAMLP